VKPIKPFKYTSGTPEGYECYRCHVTGVKLWREWNTFLDHQRLLCYACVNVEKPDAIAEHEKFKKDYPGMMDNTDQLGGMAPAVPTEDGSTFWGYSSVPQAGVEWWKALPENRPTTSA
jgi:hypothetical protein